MHTFVGIQKTIADKTLPVNLTARCRLCVHEPSTSFTEKWNDILRSASQELACLVKTFLIERLGQFVQHYERHRSALDTTLTTISERSEATQALSQIEAKTRSLLERPTQSRRPVNSNRPRGPRPQPRRKFNRKPTPARPSGNDRRQQHLADEDLGNIDLRTIISLARTLRLEKQK
jgi:hypothetical protein